MNTEQQQQQKKTESKRENVKHCYGLLQMTEKSRFARIKL